MKFLQLHELQAISRALSFDTPDLRILGGCEIYTTKAAGSDKKLYKQISSTLSSRYEADLELSNSVSPQASRAVYRTQHSPFGPLSEISARKTFAYMIATLNASHPDYDFSSVLRPSDFRKERSLRQVINTFNTTLTNLGVRGLARGKMWDSIDNEMKLRDCAVFSYAPEDMADDAYGDEGLIWSNIYFFYNKQRKRVCYLYLRGISALERKKRGTASTTWTDSEDSDDDWDDSKSIWGDNMEMQDDFDDDSN